MYLYRDRTGLGISMKKYFSIVVALILFIISAVVIAEGNGKTIINSGTCGDNLTWTLDSAGELVISGTGELNSAGSWGVNINSLIVEEGVTTIGDYAFYKSNLTRVILPDSLTSIGMMAFCSCNKLNSIYLPDSITDIWDDAFANCINLESIRLPKNLKRIAPELVNGCTNLSAFIIQEGVTEIGDYVFSNCENLKRITIPSSVRTMRYDPYYESICEEIFFLHKSPEDTLNVSDFEWKESTKKYIYRLSPIDTQLQGYGNVVYLDDNGLDDIRTISLIPESFEMTIGMHQNVECYIIPESNSTIIWDNSNPEVVAIDNQTITAISPGTTTITATVGEIFASITIQVKEHVHTIVIDEAVEPTCTSTGLTAGSHCWVCGEMIEEQQEINALGHEWDATLYTWSEDNTEVLASRICKRDESHIETESVAVTPEVTTPATCTVQGKTTYTSDPFRNVAFAIQTKTLINIDALGHQWGIPEFTWSNDNALVTARRMCARDASHVETETVSTTFEVTREATCTEKGQTTYTSDPFSNQAFAMQTRIMTDIDALGHEWGEPEYTWADDNSTVTASRICARDSSHIETETVNVTAKVTNPATCTEMGQTTYTASFASSAFSMQTKLLTNIPAVEHVVVKDPAVAPTDTESGLTEGSHCSVCGEVLTAQQLLHPLVWSIEKTDGEITIARYYGNETNLTIPFSFDDLPVRHIAADAFPNANCPTRIYIPNSVQSISNTAFGRSTTIYCNEYSEADYWAYENDYTAIYTDDIDSGTFYRISMPSAFTMEREESRRLEAVVWPMVEGTTIIVTSSNSQVVSVSGETLTAHGVGTATITLTVGGKTAAVHVTVHADPESFTIIDENGFADGTFFVVTKNTKQLVISKVEPEGAETSVTWSSSNESVATISASGEVTAKRPGQAMITAATQNGLSRSCSIIVCYPVTEIHFEQNAYQVCLGGQKQINAQVNTASGSYVNQLVRWTSSDETVAIVDQHGNVKGLQLGTVTIIASADNDVSAPCQLTVRPIQYILSLPADTTQIENEAFANLQNVDAIRIPGRVLYIAEDAFAGSNVVILTPAGSYAAQWASNHGMTVIEE